MADIKEAPKTEAPKTAAPKTAPPAGTTTVSADVDVILTVAGETAQGVAVALEHLGVAADPTSVVETGNNAALDPARPPVVDGSDLLVFFSPALVSGTYAFRFTFTWKEDIETVVPKPLKDGKYDGIEDGAAAKKPK